MADALESAWEAAGGEKKSTKAFSVIQLEFIMPRPKSRKKDKRHVTKPDVDKLCRAILDAGTTAQIWKDDSQVYRLTASKRYTSAEEPSGVRVVLEEVDV